MNADLPPVEQVPGQLKGEWAAAVIERGKARWDTARTLHVVHDDPPTLGPFPRVGHTEVDTNQTLVYLLTEPGCPSLDTCLWLHVAVNGLQVEFRVNSREALETWAQHFGLAEGSETRLSGGKLECRRWGHRLVGDKRIKVVVSGSLAAAA